MSKEYLEDLSSLMDGEISRESGMFLTRRLSSDRAMCGTWERYHLIRDCIRQPGGKQVVTGLCDKLNASLISEEVPSARPWGSKLWLKPASGLAIAASVALMAIIVTAPEQGALTDSAGNTALSTRVNQPFVSPNTLALTPVSQAVSYTPSRQANRQRLNAYLLRHNQVARTAGRQGFVSFVPIVATTRLDETGSKQESESADSENTGSAGESSKTDE